MLVARSTVNWGDGHGDVRPHVIEDIKFNGGQNGYVVCGPCGVRMEQGNLPSIELAWDLHRGVPPNQIVVRVVSERTYSLLPEGSIEYEQ